MSSEVDIAKLSKPQAAEICGVSRETIDKWCLAGLPHYIPPGMSGRKRFKESDLEEWLEKYRQVEVQQSQKRNPLILKPRIR